MLFTRISLRRPSAQLSATDLSLRAKFASLESRLLYLQFGPSVVATCPFCNSDDPRSYLYYALPELLGPHLANLVAIAVATSGALVAATAAAAGDRAAVARWRAPATLAAVALGLADVYLVASYNHTSNARALRLGDIDFFFWAARRYRYAGLAALDLLLAAALYLSGTHRAFVTAPGAAERVEVVLRALGAVKGRVNAAGVVKNTVLRDEELRGRENAYWGHEVRLMREMMEEREVIEGVKDALENRIDIRGIERDAEAYARAVLMPGGDKNGGGSAKEEVVG